MSPITFAAAMLAALPAVNALGSAIVKNQCPYPVYLWSVASGQQAPMTTVAAGSSYSETYRIPGNGGISLKLAREPNQYGAITQYEYTVTNMLWYDISNINGYPFINSGVELIPGSDSCPTKTCPAGVAECSEAYNVWNDDHATAACGSETDTTMVLCSNAPATRAAPVVNEAVDASNQADEVAAPVVDEAAAAVTPAPAPSASEAADAPAPAYTTFVTQMVTAFVDADGNGIPDIVPRAAAPTAAPEKRHEDAHMQKRAAHRHHFHRHAADSN